MNEITSIDKQVHEVNNKVTAILEILRGNELDREDKGFIGRVNNHELRIMRLEKLLDKGKWILIGMGIPSGYGIANFLVWIIDHISNK